MLLAALLFFQHLVLEDLPKVDKNPYTSVGDLEQGKKLYLGRCAGCHGPTGDGGKGANLATPVLARGDSDLALYRTIRYGLPDTEMPAHNMTEREIWQMATYVRSLGQGGLQRVNGNSRRGAALVRGRGGCLQCHLLNGEGGLIGPALSSIGRRRSASYLKEKLLDPGKELAADFSVVTLRTAGGSKITGVWMNEDTWSIQVRDLNARLHSYWKQDLAELAVERRTMMPSYAGQLNQQEQNDIVAFLGGLR
jgi:cytochrome c oxidase cbb3-type subunit 3